MKIISTFAILVLLAGPLLAQSPGEMTYSTKCSQCHGSDLAGQTTFGKKYNIPDLRSPAIQGKSDKELTASIGRGEGHKEYPHAFLARGMSTNHLQQVINYIRSAGVRAAK